VTRPLRPEVTEEVVDLFYAYYQENPAWGSLHVVLDDGNYEDHCVEGAIEWAMSTNRIRKQPDMMGWMLARILLGFSKGQRHKIAQKCYQREHAQREAQREAQDRARRIMYGEEPFRMAETLKISKADVMEPYRPIESRTPE
jgi:hypothetical protein